MRLNIYLFPESVQAKK